MVKVYTSLIICISEQNQYLQLETRIFKLSFYGDRFLANNLLILTSLKHFIYMYYSHALNI